MSMLGNRQAECSVVLHHTAHTGSGECPCITQSRYDTVIDNRNSNNILMLYSLFIVIQALCRGLNYGRDYAVVDNIMCFIVLLPD